MIRTFDAQQQSNPQFSQIYADSMQRDPETFAIIGAAIEVHRELGRKLQRGLLVNFGASSLQYKRLVLKFSDNL